MITRQEFFAAIEKELAAARAKHGTNSWNRHEFHSILREEYEEVWADIKSHAPTEQMMKEVLQICAACLHYAETGDERLGEHPPLDVKAPIEREGWMISDSFGDVISLSEYKPGVVYGSTARIQKVRVSIMDISE